MRIFVTGAAGYIGSVCVESLLAGGHVVRVYDNMAEGHHDAVTAPAELVVGDLLDGPLLKKSLTEFKPDAVLHFAGRALVGESMRDPGIYYAVNVTGGCNLLEAMVAAGCKKIVFSSSCATYGLPEKIPIDERCPQKPINPYGHSKLLFEQILKWYEQVYGMVHINLRYFNAAGATQKNGEDRKIETHLIPIVLDVALGKRPQIAIFGDKHNTPDGTCIRDYIHVLDLADAHLLALGRTASASYNVGTGEGVSVLQVIEACRKVTGHPIPAVIEPPRAGDPPRLVASANRIKMDLGWKPQFTKIHDTVASAWEWRRAHPQGYAR
ncbi:MAG: UDP-glucose 4-epimerase GalE [Candidatus Methylacidiphilales bacterium]|nr:UDP-glucose 4-epimerase GalE [Candidatus Methylacidiphilales bacterium]